MATLSVTVFFGTYHHCGGGEYHCVTLYNSVRPSTSFSADTDTPIFVLN